MPLRKEGAGRPSGRSGGGGAGAGEGVGRGVGRGTGSGASGGGELSMHDAVHAIATGSTAIDEERQKLFAPCPNAIQWVVGPAWGNSPTLYQQPKQWQLVRDFFGLRCPVCNTGDPEIPLHATRLQLESETLLEWSSTYDDNVCPKCGVTREEYITRGVLPQYNRLHLVCGQRAGKTTVAAEIARFIEHTVLRIAHTTQGGLQHHLGLPAHAKFHAMYLAASAVNASETIWAAYTSLRHESPWFLRYLSWVKDEEARQLRARGVPPWSYAETDREILNEHPDVKLTISSGTTNAPAQRGTTRLWAMIDEISHMLQTDSVRGARENYRVMWNSLHTALTRVRLFASWPWLGSLASFTSPKSRDDRGMEILNEVKDDPHLLAVHAATWDFNPLEPEEGFELQRRLDPVGVARDFGARPPGAAYPLVHDEARFRALTLAVPLEPTMAFGVRAFSGETAGASGVGSPVKQAYVEPYIEHVGPVRFDAFDSGVLRFIAFDAGLTHDAFTGTCMHGMPILDDEDQLIGYDVFQDWVFRVVPPPGHEVYFDAILAILGHASRLYRIGGVAFDHWQSHPLVQQARLRYGLYAEEETTLPNDYEAFLTNALLGRVHLLPPALGDFDEQGLLRRTPIELSPAGAQLYEVCRLEQDPVTRKVTNPRKGKGERGADSDDAARVMVHAHRMVVRAGYVERQDDRSVRARRQRLLGELDHWQAGLVGSAHGVQRFGPGAGGSGGRLGFGEPGRPGFGVGSAGGMGGSGAGAFGFRTPVGTVGPGSPGGLGGGLGGGFGGGFGGPGRGRR